MGTARVIKGASSGRELHRYHALPGDRCILTSSCLPGNSNYHGCGVVREQIEILDEAGRRKFVALQHCVTLLTDVRP